MAVQKSFDLLGIYQVCGNVGGSLYTSAYLIVTNVMRQALPSRAQRRNRPGKFQELSPSLPDGRQLIWIQWWIWNGPHQGSLTSQAMPRFAQCWGVLRKAALTACAPEELLEIPLISTGKSAQAGPLSSLVQRSLGWEVASASAWEAPASAGILLTLGSSIFTHPLVSQRKKRQNILAEQANGSQMTEVKKKKKVKKFCNMLLFKSKKKLPTSLFWVFLSLFELSVL